MSKFIELSGVHKSYGQREVLRGLDLIIDSEEIVGFLGANGSGKTTTLRILAGLISVDSGDVRIGGCNLRSNSLEIRRRVGYLAEKTPLYHYMTIEEYLGFIASIKLCSKRGRGEGRGEAIDKVLESFNLEDRRRQIIGKLSKGLQQRVGLAQAFLGDPDILLLDEPFSSLDLLQIIEVRELLKEAGKGRTVLFSSHIMNEVATLSTRVVVLYEGQLLAMSRSECSSEEEIENFFLKTLKEKERGKVGV